MKRIWLGLAMAPLLWCTPVRAQGDELAKRVDRWIENEEFGEAESRLREMLGEAEEPAHVEYALGRLIAAHAASPRFQASTPAGLVKTRFSEAASFFERSLEGSVPEDARLRCAGAYYWATEGERAHEVLKPLLAAGDADAWRLEGDVRGFIQGDWPAALEAYEKAVSADPALAGIELRIADAQARLGELELAREALAKHLERHSTDPQVFDRIWGWFVASRRYADAVSLYGQALDADPRNFMALYHLGIVKRQTQEYDVAAELLDRALELRPEATEVRYHRALVDYARGDYDAAAEQALDVLAAEPDHAGAREIVRTVAGWHGSRREHAAALELLQALRDSGEADSGLWMDIALTLKHLGREEEAEAAYRKAAEADPFAGAPWNDLGILLQSQGKLDTAAEAYRRAIDTEIDIENSLENLAVLALLQSSASGVGLEEAERALKQLLELDPSRSRARLYLERLRRSGGR